MAIVYKNDSCARVLQRKSSKMKELLTVVSLLLSGVVAEAPYEASGWRPNGPSFELPQRIPAQVPQKQEYLPPVDPRRPVTPPEFDSGVDVSVQGLPTGEQQPIFQVSPINGQQYSGPNYQADIRSLDQTLQQIQYQQQLEKQREFARQRQFEAARGNTRANGLPNPQPPRSFVPQTTTTTQRPEPRTEATTESDLNEGEEYDETKDSAPKQKVSVEVTKQNIQEYPPELFLTPLAQFKVQPQFIQLPQLGQLRASLYYQPIQQEPERQQAEGFNGPAHFAALPSVLAQQQLAQSQPAPQPQPINQNPAFIIARGQESAPAYLVPTQQEPLNQPFNQYQPVQPQPQQPLNQYQPFNNQFQPQQEPLNQYQPFNNQFQPVQQPQQEPNNQFQINSQYQPLIQPQAFPQFQAQPVVLPPQTANQLPNQYAPAQQPEVEEVDEEQAQQPESRQPQPQPQFIYQQPEVYNPRVNQYQPQQAGFGPQPQIINFPAQDWNRYYQNQYPHQFDSSPAPQGNEGQGSLQSGLDVNQQGNGIDQRENEDPEDEQNDGSRATAVATAFGTRTQPRVFLQYGAPASRPQGNPGFSATTEAPQEEVTEDGPAIAQATAVATGSRKSAKLRSRRVRPIFTLDRSGHLVLAQEQ